MMKSGGRRWRRTNGGTVSSNAGSPSTNDIYEIGSQSSSRGNGLGRLGERRRHSSMDSVPKYRDSPSSASPHHHLMDSVQFSDGGMDHMLTDSLDGTSDGADASSRAGAGKKKKNRFPFVKKSIIHRNQHRQDMRISLNSSGQSIGDDESGHSSPKVSRFKGYAKQSNILKKKRVSTMQTLRNRVLPRKSKLGKQKGLGRRKAGDDEGFDDDSDYQETVHSEDDGEDDGEEEDGDEDEDEVGETGFDDQHSVPSDYYQNGMEYGSPTHASKSVSTASRLTKQLSPRALAAGMMKHRSRRSSADQTSAAAMVRGARGGMNEEDSYDYESHQDQQQQRQPAVVQMPNSTRGTSSSSKVPMVDRYEYGATASTSSSASPSTSTKPTEMADFLKKKLEEWQVPKSQWKIPHGSPSNGSAGNYDAYDQVDPRANAKLINKIREAFDRTEQRAYRLREEIEKLKEDTHTQMRDMLMKMRALEKEMDDFENEVGRNEKTIREKYQNYKSEMQKEIRDKIKRQLEKQEAEYFDSLHKIQENINILSSNTSTSNSPFELLLHTGFSLAVSGAGTIAHIVAMIIGIILHPIAAVTSLFRSGKGDPTKKD